MKDIQCDNILIEEYIGKVSMDFISYYKYLGHYVSNINDNSVHLNKMKEKSFIIQKSIFNYLDKLKLGK